ncbi:hypothetical protein AVEN_270594-1, partial [Araneus ventricosus]
MTITGHDPTPLEGGTHYHWQRASLNHYCTHVQEQEPVYLYGGFSSTYIWCLRVGQI